ncbi:MAG: TolC family protein [Bacteroidales bacterium]|jgi:outer membrane protein|nr:TolC family protein [Bacteroidales bacterium]MDY0085563.1 TolC family protein [Bacteroidales bacterium]
MNTHNSNTSFGYVKFVLIISLVMIFISGGLMAQKWTLEDCVNYALEHNIQIQQSRLEVQAGEINQLESKLDFLPSLNAQASHAYGWGRSIDMATYTYVDEQTQQSYFDINSSVTLFNGFQKVNTMKQRRSEYLAAKYSADKIKNDIALSVAGYYLQILFNHELLNNAKRQREVTEQQVNRTNKLVEAGTLARGSLLEIQAQLANEEVSVVQAENQLNLAYLDLLQLLEMEADTDLEIAFPTLIVSRAPELLPVDYIYNTALGVMPEIKQAEQNVEGTERALAIAKGSRSPSLSLNAGIGTNYSDKIFLSNNPLDPNYREVKPFDDQIRDNRNTTLSFRLSIPIFNGYQSSSYINRSKLNLLNADYNLQLAKNSLRKNVETAYTDALAAYKSYQAREKSLRSLNESFNYTQQKFDRGMVNALDYNMAKNQLNIAESELLSSKYDFIFKLKVLEFYLGKTLTLADMADYMEE